MLDKPAGTSNGPAQALRLIKEGFRPPVNVNKSARCESCIFGSNTCVSAGPVDSPFVIVGESPGKQETLFQWPFIGESGDLLKSTLYKVGFSDQDCPQPYLTNAVKCLPDGRKDQSTMAAACKACRSQLYKEISAYPRKVILALGASALWSLTGDFKLKITQSRGIIFPSPLAAEGIIACLHPAFLLRGGGSMQKFMSDVRLAVEKVKGEERVTYKPSQHIVLDTVEDFYRVMQRLDYTIWWHEALGLPQVEIGTDLETSGFSALDDFILCALFGWEDTINYVVPGRVFDLTRGDHGDGDPVYLQAVRLFYEYLKVSFVWHNGKFDIQFLWSLNIRARVDEDTMLLSYTLDENRGLHDLEQVANDAIKAPNWKHMLEEHLPYKGASYAYIPDEVLHRYGGLDIAATIQTFRVLRKRVAKDDKLERAYSKTMIPASNMLALVETNGIWVDPEQNQKLDVQLRDDMAQCVRELNDLTIAICDRTFSITSPIQVAELLYDILKLPEVKGCGKSTDKETLAALPQHDIVKIIRKHRKLAKSHGTYVVNLFDRNVKKGKTERSIKRVPGHVKSDTRVHSTYLIHGTVTGRLSSAKPNMQNIPRESEIRGQFAAPKGRILIEVDLNQAELRSLAELSGDPGLITIYTDPTHPGLHHETSIAIFGEGYTGEHKMLAKAVNFGIVYGRSGTSIAEAHNMPLQEGEEWINKWARRFPIAWDFIQSCREAPLKGHALFTCFGRKRRFGVISRNNLNAVGNEASNFPHQSTASDITLHAHVELNQDPRYKGLTVNLIHDAGLHEVDNDPEIVDYQTALIIHYMESIAPKWGLTKVPFKADAKTGHAWGKLKNFKPKGDYHFST